MQISFKRLNLLIWKPVLGLLLLLLWLGGASFVRADNSQDDLKRINTHIEQAATAAQAGNITLAQSEFKAFDDAWFGIEDGVRAKSKDFYRAIEERLHEVEDIFAKPSVDTQSLQKALENLNKINLAYINGAALPGNNPQTAPVSTPAATSPAPTNQVSSDTDTTTPTMSSLLKLLDKARDLEAKADWAGASAVIKKFQDNWLVVEGQVKTRSPEDYRNTENDMALAYNLAVQKSPELKSVLDRMSERLEPYREANSYGIFDATLILLREGLEALLVVVALLAFLKKSGNNTKQSWIWGGSVAGLVSSIVLGLVIQMLFSSAMKSGNREVLEGSVGLIAAVMLIYVSYWMHSKSSTMAWQRYIRAKSTSALAKGSLFGLALLAFLAIFREGAETVLFLLGMGSNISLTNLFIGLAIGAALLGVLGVLLVVVGVRIPMGPFFRVTSILVFYLCFKFVGTGVHALQVGGVLSSTSASYLPENDFFGLFPTWETIIAQLVLLLIGAGIVLYTHFKAQKEEAITAKTVESAKSNV